MQSIWQTELGKKFKRAESDLERNWRDFSPEILEKKVKNLEKGLKMLENLVISGNFPPIFRKKYPWDAKNASNLFENQTKNSGKTAENVVFLEILGKKVGIFEGKSHFSSEKIPIFNHVDFFSTFCEAENPKQTFLDLFPVIEFFEAMPVLWWS